MDLGRTRVGCSLFTDDRIGLLALLLKTSALYKAYVDPHQSIYPPTHPPVHLYFLPIPIYPVILQERKKEKGSFGKEAHPCVWTQFCKKSFLANTAISLGICSPALPVSAVSPASPSFPLLTGLLPALCTYSHVPTMMGTFFLLSALLLTHQVGRTPGLPLQLGFYG